MKICLLAPANNPHTQKIAYTLVKKGYEIIIYTFHDAILNGIKVKYFPPIFSSLGKVNYLLNYKSVKNYVKDMKPDILHAHYISSYGIVGTLIQFHPFVISVWGTDIYDATKNPFLGYMIKKTLNNADCILSTSHTMAKRVGQFVKKNVIVTPFGVDLSKFYPSKKNITNKFIIGTARRLTPKYGIIYLIKAFSFFINEVPNAELHIAGDGPQKNKLVALVNNLKIANKVKFMGYIDHQNMPMFLSNLDIFVMPSIDESFGVAALEAQACGIPIIASNVGGLHETIIDNKTGFLVPSKNSKIIAQKLIFLYKNKEVYKEMSYNCINFVKEKYNWSQNFEIINNVYKNLIKKEL